MTAGTAAASEELAPAATQPRRRSPSYDVLELRELQTSTGETVEAWLLIAQAVSAIHDREAIDSAIADRPDEERVGTFWAPRTGTPKPQTRAARTTTTLVWE